MKRGFIKGQTPFWLGIIFVLMLALLLACTTSVEPVHYDAPMVSSALKAADRVPLWSSPLLITAVISGFLLLLAAAAYFIAGRKAAKLKVTQDAPKHSDELMRIALSHLSCMMFEIDYRTGKADSCNSVSGADSPCFISDALKESGDFSLVVHPSYPEPVDDAIRRAAAGESTVEYDLRLRTGNDPDEYSWFELRITNVFDSDGNALVGVGTFENIDARKKREMHLSRMALHDSFTGLLNRTEGARLVNDYLAAPYSEGGTMIIFDMDNLKEINNAYGHPAGDRAITLMSDAMKGVFRSSDIMMRIGGDEFIVFLRNLVDDEFIEKRYSLMKQRLLDLYKGAPLPKGIISFSLGYANVYQGDTFDCAYIKADIALYHAKSSGKGTYAVYDKNMSMQQQHK